MKKTTTRLQITRNFGRLLVHACSSCGFRNFRWLAACGGLFPQGTQGKKNRKKQPSGQNDRWARADPLVCPTGKVFLDGFPEERWVMPESSLTCALIFFVRISCFYCLLFLICIPDIDIGISWIRQLLMKILRTNLLVGTAVEEVIRLIEY